MLAYISAKQVLTKAIWLEVAIWDGQVDGKESQKPQKVSVLF